MRNIDKGATEPGTHMYNGQAWHKIGKMGVLTPSGKDGVECDCCGLTLDARMLTSSDPVLINAKPCYGIANPPSDKVKAHVKQMQFGAHGGKAISKANLPQLLSRAMIGRGNITPAMTRALEQRAAAPKPQPKKAR